LSEFDFKLREAKELPVYRRAEISKHRTLANKVWVSYEDGVYDITQFLKVHPGGAEKLMMAAGGAIEPFWEMYPFHKKDTVK
jgi:sulfite oxidase